MTKEAQAGRAYIETALAMKQIAGEHGVADPQRLARLLGIGSAVETFIVGHQPAQVMVGGERFAKILDGGLHIMTADTFNSLVWDVTDFGGKRMTFEEAEKACRELRTGGHTDWRLPAIRELLTLVDYERCSPALDPEYFPNTSTDYYYRTSTPYAPLSGCAWGVYFYHGHSGALARDDRCCVRAVRPSQGL